MTNTTPARGLTIAERESHRRRTMRKRRDRYWRYRQVYGREGNLRTLAISIGIALLAIVIGALWDYFTTPVGEDRHGPVALCHGQAMRSCLIDGDTGRDNGRKWRLFSIDAPELAEPQCDNEKRLALASRDRLQELLSGPYRIRHKGRDDPHGRALVDLTLADGRDVGRILISEGLAQRWPNRGNVWCSRGTEATVPLSTR